MTERVREILSLNADTLHLLRSMMEIYAGRPA
jgi:hypothetical protein